MSSISTKLHSKIKTKGVPNKINGKVYHVNEEYPEETRFPHLFGFQNRDMIIDIIDKDPQILMHKQCINLEGYDNIEDIRLEDQDSYANFLLSAIERCADPNEYIDEVTDGDSTEKKCRLVTLYHNIKLIMW